MFVATTLALTIALSPVTQLGMSSVVPSTYAWMAPATACPRLEPRVVLQIDTKALGSDGEGVGNRLRGQAEREIQGFDLMLGTDAAKDLPVVIIKIVVIKLDARGRGRRGGGRGHRGAQGPGVDADVELAAVKGAGVFVFSVVVGDHPGGRGVVDVVGEGGAVLVVLIGEVSAVACGDARGA